MSFNGKVVIITGAGGGIGSATAAHFAKLGAALTIVDIDKTTLKATSEVCRSNGAQEILDVTADLRKECDVKKVIDETLKKFGQIDVLINNAGISSKQCILEENFLDKYQEIFDVNLKAPMLLTHLAAPHLIATKGNVINITSVGGIHPLPGLLIYNSSKAALRHFTKCVALELAPKGVRVNAIAPAAVKTNMVKLLGIQNIEEFEREREKQLPLKKMIDCDEVAQLIEFLASASSITGTEYVIDAGHLLGGTQPNYSSR